MGYDFLGRQGDWYYRLGEWQLVAKLAFNHGWSPLGTAAPSDWPTNLDWVRANYFTNDRQYVLPEDAAALADALECAIDALPPVAPHVDDDEFDLRLSARPEWDEPDAKSLREFIRFCRTGGFTIA